MRATRFLTRQARRAISFGFALRLGILVSGLAALWLPIPELDHWLMYVGIIVPIPLLAMVRPDKPFATGTHLLAVLLLLIDGYLVDEISPIMAIGIGICCYVHHTCAAMAALWRVDTTVEPRVWQGWLLRLGIVVLLSAVLAGIVAVVTGQPLTGPPALLAAAGACVVLGVVATVAWLYHRSEV